MTYKGFIIKKTKHKPQRFIVINYKDNKYIHLINYYHLDTLKTHLDSVLQYDDFKIVKFNEQVMELINER